MWSVAKKGGCIVTAGKAGAGGGTGGPLFWVLASPVRFHVVAVSGGAGGSGRAGGER